ncbi:hypothetical protein, partial [Amycolatopsis magusensis]
GGSVLSAEPGTVSRVLVMTSLAAAAGAMGACLVSNLLFKSNDLTMVLNGILAGLVGITAGADQMDVVDSVGGGLLHQTGHYQRRADHARGKAVTGPEGSSLF